VTLMTPDGAFGGPLSVAVNQARAQVEQGHDAHIACLVAGFADPFSAIGVVPLHGFRARRLVPGAGFSGITSARFLLWLARHAESFDVVHVHLARDLVTMPAARWLRHRRRRFVTQSHGMVMPDTRWAARVYDKIFTRKVLRSACPSLFLTDEEADGLRQIAGSELNSARLVNGVAVPSEVHENLARSAVEVLFLARLQTRKRPITFARVAMRLAERHPAARFCLAGPDQGELPALRELLSSQTAGSTVAYEGAVPPAEVMRRLSQADIYVLPSVHEPFPMSVLEAMSAGKPVVITSSCGLAQEVNKNGAGIVVDESEAALESAIDTLLTDSALRQTMGANASRLVRSAFSIESVTQSLLGLYTSG
jgi:glycosyltransferase involved in cell wall biosynthesis